MIADIEFRWVKRSGVSKGIPTAKEVWDGHTLETILQFRKLILDADPELYFKDKQKPVMRWTPWQDVPVAEE